MSEQYRSITQNLANASTTGYKRKVTAFSLAMTTQMASRKSDGLSASKVVDHLGVDFTQGSMRQTGSPFDLALNGDGFFVIESTSGPVYTRSGSFRLSPQGQLVDLQGRTVAGESGPIIIPSGVSAQSVKIGDDGEVTANAQVIGKVKMVEFTDPNVLTPVGANCFEATAGAQPQPASDTRISQGFQESSNVSVVEELVGLITVSRLYEANLKNIQAQDERMKSLLSVASR